MSTTSEFGGRDDFSSAVLATVPETPPSGPRAFYNEDGDCIEFLFSDESFFAERIDKFVTVFYGRESGEIVGSLIKGVRRFVKDMVRESPGFAIEVEDDQVCLTHLFTAGMWKQGDVVQVRKYQKLRDAALRGQTRVAVPHLA